MNIKTWIYSLLLIIAASGSTWLTISVTKEISVAHIDQPTNIDSFINNAKYTEFDQQGEVYTEIYSSQVVHYPGSDNYIFTKPKVVIKVNKKPIWTITADRGKTSHRSETIYLWNNVILEKKPGKNQPAIKLTTKSIIVYPSKKYAETKDRVKITQGVNTMSAKGAKADLKNGTLKLVSNTVGAYLIEQ